MKIREYLNAHPEPQNLRLFILTGAILTIVTYSILGYFFLLSGAPTDVPITGQLSFSGAVMKSIHSRIKDMGAYRVTQQLDYVLMLSYGLLFWSLSLQTARKFTPGDKLNKIGMLITTGVIAAPLLDVIENIFILMMLSNPLNFPDWWAVAHSIFALPKWILLMIAIGWILIGNILAKKMKK